MSTLVRLSSLMKPNLKFNGGAGAVLCEQCRVIVHSHFNNIQWKALMDLDVPCYCKNCDEEKNLIFEQKYEVKINELLKEMPDVF